MLVALARMSDNTLTTALIPRIFWTICAERNNLLFGAARALLTITCGTISAACTGEGDGNQEENYKIPHYVY